MCVSVWRYRFSLFMHVISKLVDNSVPHSGTKQLPGHRSDKIASVIDSKQNTTQPSRKIIEMSGAS